MLASNLDGRCPTAPALEFDLHDGIEHATVALEELRRTRPAPSAEPAGFIFHMSRTGSTVTGSMLRATSGVAFVSEPLAVNDLFFRLDSDEDLLDERLRFIIDWFVTALAGTGRVVFKFSSWVALHLDRLRKLYPSVPCAFIHREPVEVVSAIVSRAPAMFRREEMRARFAARAHDDPAFEKRTVNALRGRVDYRRDCDYVEFVASFIGAICEPPAAAYAAGRSILPVNYSTFKEQVIEELAPAFGVEIDAPTRQRMLEATRYDGKARGRVVFQKDSTLKRQTATPLMAELCRQYIQPSIDILMSAAPQR